MASREARRPERMTVENSEPRRMRFLGDSIGTPSGVGSHVSHEKGTGRREGRTGP
ncbi:hypothetical protein GCM10026982_46420 [Nocardiopsis aegyptia]